MVGAFSVCLSVTLTPLGHEGFGDKSQGSHLYIALSLCVSCSFCLCALMQVPNSEELQYAQNTRSFLWLYAEQYAALDPVT